VTDVVNAVESIKNTLNVNLVDPWEAAASSTRTVQFFTNDFRLTGTFPKGQIVLDGDSPEKIQWGGKANYKESISVDANIFYYNKPEFKYYADSGSTLYEDGGTNDAKSLNRYMLEQIRETLVKFNGSLTGINKLRFGTVVSTQHDREHEVYWGYVPISFDLIKNIGG